MQKLKNPIIRFCGYVDIMDQIWFINREFNALISVDKSDGIIKKILKIPSDPIDKRCLFFSVFKIGDDLVGVPDNDDKIIIYNINDNVFSDISIKKHVKISAISNYKAAYLYKDEIIMLPNRADKIVVYNHSEKNISTISIKNNALDALYQNRVIQFRPQYEIIDEHLFIPYAQAGGILKLNLTSKQAEVRLVDGLSGCDTINYYNGMFYLASWNEKKIYAVDMNFHIVDVYTQYPDGFEADKCLFAYSLRIDKKILFFPQLGNMILSFDLEDKTIKEEMRVQMQDSDIAKTYFVKADKNEAVSLMHEDSWLSAFSYVDGVLCKKPYCTWDEARNSKVIEKYLKDNCYFGFVHERNGIGLDMIINLLEDAGSACFSQEESGYAGAFGKKIYGCISGEQK